MRMPSYDLAFIHTLTLSRHKCLFPSCNPVQSLSFKYTSKRTDTPNTSVLPLSFFSLPYYEWICKSASQAHTFSSPPQGGPALKPPYKELGFNNLWRRRRLELICTITECLQYFLVRCDDRLLFKKRKTGELPDTLLCLTTGHFIMDGLLAAACVPNIMPEYRDKQGLGGSLFLFHTNRLASSRTQPPLAA